MKHRIRLCLSLWFKLMRVSYQILYGLLRLSKAPQPLISIFGGARFTQDDLYAKKAHELSNMFTNVGISVVTGGGSGIMEAASCGALEKKEGGGLSIGIGVKDLGEGRNVCVSNYIELDYFFARKWLLTRYSTGFVVFPGGFGTLDELAQVLTLIQTNKLPRAPIALVGVEYWQPFMHWLEHEALKHGTIEQKDLDLFIVTNDLEKVFCYVRDACTEQESHDEQNGEE